MEGLGIVGQCIELAHARKALEGQPMNMKDYTESVFQQGARTAWRRLADFGEWMEILPKENGREIVQVIAEKGGTLLRGAAGAGMRELIGTFNEVRSEIPKSKAPRTIEVFIEQRIRPKLKERRQRRRGGGKPEPLQTDDALKEAFRAVVKVMERTKLDTPDQEREWLTTLTGYVIDARKISGAIRTGRRGIPDGFIVKRGPKPKKRS